MRGHKSSYEKSENNEIDKRDEYDEQLFSRFTLHSSFFAFSWSFGIANQAAIMRSLKWTRSMKN